MLTDEQRKALSAIGSEGGKTTAKRHGKEHYQKLAANMNKKLGRTGKKSTQGLTKTKLDMPFDID